jgi:hypothetical protein
MLRTAGEGTADWWHQAHAKAIADADNAYQRGRQVYEAAIRTGQQVAAQTPSQVSRLGRAGNAAVRAAGNAISLDQADKLEALTEAAFGAGSGGFQDRYRQRFALQQQADADARNEFPELYKWSDRAGAVGALLALDSPAAFAPELRASCPEAPRWLRRFKGSNRRALSRRDTADWRPGSAER